MNNNEYKDNIKLNKSFFEAMLRDKKEKLTEEEYNKYKEKIDEYVDRLCELEYEDPNKFNLNISDILKEKSKSIIKQGE